MSFLASRSFWAKKLMNTIDPRDIYGRLRQIHERTVPSTRLGALEHVPVRKTTWKLRQRRVRQLPFPNHTPLAHPVGEYLCLFCRANDAAPFVIESECVLEPVICHAVVLNNDVKLSP
ncbi:hypothetical protein BDZ89DRAFT_1144390 [Hymenopellis radicata]|nr:hypothetical protein BDZ89DRAFT_1144390 [Hymenopellis radicata]